MIGGTTTNNTYLSSVELYNSTTETWQTITNAMTVARAGHTATLLSNGKVLVAGGFNVTNQFLASAELYDPVAGTWKVTLPMESPRANHTATLLHNGKVLVVGGTTTGYLSTASAEVYDPKTGNWMLTGSLNVSRESHTATLLPNGRVLVSGGIGGTNGTALSSTELYDPATGNWTTTTSLNAPRAFHCGTLLPNGKVLVVGGFRFPSYLNSAELFDPANESWTLTATAGKARQGSTATLLSNGKVMVVGGANDDGNDQGYPALVELYDVGLAFSNSWRPRFTSVPSQLNLGNSLLVAGAQFRGISSSTGGTAPASPTDYPLLQLRSIEGKQTTFLLAINWSTNSFASPPVWNFPPGHAFATLFVNGIPSTSSIVNIAIPIPVDVWITNIRKLTNGTFQFSFTNSVGAVFGALASTNIALPLNNWTPLGGVTEVSPGRFQFMDPPSTNAIQRYYRVWMN